MTFMVKGGIYTDTNFESLVPGTEEVYGPYEYYQDAMDQWKRASFSPKLDIAGHRLFIIDSGMKYNGFVSNDEKARFQMSLILNTDSYKMSHFLGYPKGLTHMHSYLESRGGKYPATLFVGLRPILRQIEDANITVEDVEYAKEFAAGHAVPFNYDGWMRIATVHNGSIPVRIKAVPEGTLVPTGNVLLTIENTDDQLPWLTSYLETMLLRIWYPITVATRIYYMREKIRAYFDNTSDNMNGLPFALLDFSSRGVSSLETSKIGGSAYLMLFQGSDNVPAVDFTNTFYNEGTMSGFSVPATEHSIMCAFGEENEEASFKYLLDNMGQDGGILSVVSDTWNIYRATEYWGKLADEIKRRNITLVVRPDSGEIEDVLPKMIERLIKSFGIAGNSKGFNVLNNVKILWGDGINEDTCTKPFDIAQSFGISADSIITGSGGGLMQANIDRDTCKFAIKGSYVTFEDGTGRGIAKDPITDHGKRSKQGRLALVHRDGEYQTISYEETPPEDDLLRVMFVDGIAFDDPDHNLEAIRERINQQNKI